jgi:uncharacterized protein HemY
MSTLLFAGRYGEALEGARLLAEAEPEFAVAHGIRAMAAALSGDTEAAVQAAEATDRLARSDQLSRSIAGWALGVCGQSAAARAVLAALERAGARRYVGMSFPAAIHAGLGDPASALECLERAVADRCMWLPFMGVDPRFAALRENPRFREIVMLASGGCVTFG